MAAVTIYTDFGAQEKKIYHYFHFSTSICKEVMGLDAMILVFLNIEFQARFFTFMHWRRKWQPTPVFFPGESQGRWSLMGCRLWGHTESDTTEAT